MTRRVAHSEVINPAIACIYDQMRQRIVGTGFTLTERHVVTCAHVVNAALERHEAELTPPSEQAQITLSFLNSPEPELQRELTAKVVRWLPKASGFYDNDDIAILELLDLPKPLALPKLVRLDKCDYFSQRPFQAFGFNVSEGSWAHGQIGGLTAQDTIQLNMERPIEQGFSGAPVWDKAERGVIGMLITIRVELKMAYMIPLARLLEIFPDADKVTIPRNPYRGLAMFEEQHAQDFFGREQVTQALTQRVENSPFVLLMGISGSGKSSVLNAGLTYQLHQQGNWLVIKVRPFNQAFHDLARGLLNVLYTDPIERATQEKTLIDQLEQQSISLASLCHSALQANGKERLLLIVDQFEELYTHSIEQKTQASYIDLLLSLLTDASGKLGLLLSLRADFMARLLAYTPLAQTLQTYTAQQFILTGMSKDELRSAIVEPAEQLGVSLEQGLVERILHELAEDSAGQLPLLEFALTELWQRQQGRCLTHQALDEIGGVAHALAQHAEQVFKSYSAPDQEAIKRIMVKLIAPGAGSEDTRQVARFSDFSPADQTLLPRLASERLIVTGKELGEDQQTLEVIHEALIREWGALQAWMDEYREFRVWEERLKIRLADWGKHAKATDDLLIGRYLLEAQEYLGSHAVLLSEEEQSFIRLSVKTNYRKKLLRQGAVLGIIVILSTVIAIIYSSQQKLFQKESETNELINMTVDFLDERGNGLLSQFFESVSKQKLTLTLLESIRVRMNSIYELKMIVKTQDGSVTIQNNSFIITQNDVSNFVINSYASLNTEDVEKTYELKLKKYNNLIELIHRQAIEADPKNAINLINLAKFMTDIRHNYDEAEQLYRRAIEADPKHANSLGNYAQLKLAKGDYEEGKELVDRSFAANNGQNPLLDLELWFYRLAHFPKDYPEAQEKILTLLENPENREQWNFSRNIERAKQENNPHVKFLEAVAEVINKRADFDSLNPYMTE